MANKQTNKQKMAADKTFLQRTNRIGTATPDS